MKNLIILTFVLCFSIPNVYSQNDDLKESITKLYKLLNTKKESSYSFREVINETLEVNSVSNARFKGGETRKGISLNLPKNTSIWYYRITVLELNDSFRLRENEKLVNQIKNKDLELFNRANEQIDFYIIPESNIANFLQTGNNNFMVYKNFTKNNTSDFFETSKVLGDDFWIGIKNNNKFKGLKVIVEVVAFGKF
ncbi:hypothetical protein [Lutibacter sp.]|uniref:hypothetical protein n=1 Tax=Lutibacter sp. TaxID=1925666 RepID=UPI0025BD565B|nr:hypothetical protein [Lutibacter sp.]MCF6180500.1 hypothetical protein [Lutibacter sp.]